MGAQLSLTAALLYFVTNAPFMLITEETGWRGFALPRLQAQHSALIASLLIGLIWGIWHTPLFFMAGAQSSYPYVAFVLFAMAESILTTWIFNHTHGSVLLTLPRRHRCRPGLHGRRQRERGALLAGRRGYVAGSRCRDCAGRAASLARTQADSEAGVCRSLPDLRA
ncbi:MAG: CPBP family intramembrane glutamic endopeptidase [Caldilineaceae bacterium]